MSAYTGDANRRRYRVEALSPSRQDVEMTECLRKAGKLLGIVVLDHIVFAAEGYVSLAERDWR